MAKQLTKEVAERIKRMKRLREISNRRTQKAFAEWLGISHTRWNNIECGLEVSKEVENLLVEKFPGLSVEWIRSGERRQLTSFELDRRLNEPD